VFRIYALVASPAQVDVMRDRYLRGAIGYEEAKSELAIAIAERFAQPMERFEEWKNRPDDIRDILRNGARAVSTEVGTTLALVREHLGLAL
jgi:tryptophanyl-tRNA synthetase